MGKNDCSVTSAEGFKKSPPSKLEEKYIKICTTSKNIEITYTIYKNAIAI